MSPSVRLSVLTNKPLLATLKFLVFEVLMNEGLLGIILAGCGQLAKMPITLELQGIYGCSFAYLSI